MEMLRVENLTKVYGTGENQGRGKAHFCTFWAV